MALTLHNFIGFETGGLEEASATSGSPAVNTTFPRTGRYYLKLAPTGSSDQYDIDAFLEGTDQGDYYVLGFAYRAEAVTTQSILEARDTGGSVIWTLKLTSGNYLRITDQASTDFTATTTQLVTDNWYYIEISWESTGANDQMDVYLDGSSELAITTADLDTGTALGTYRFGITGPIIYIDDFYCYSGASSGATNMLGASTRVLGAFCNTAEDATDQGTTLGSGTWANTSIVPISTITFGQYSGDNDQGHTRLDEGQWPNILEADKFYATVAQKFLWHNIYASTKTPMYCRWGYELSGSDVMSNVSVTPTKSWVTYQHINAADNGEDWLNIGADNGGTKNDVSMAACLVFVLITTEVQVLGNISQFDPVPQNSYGGPFSV